MSGLNFACQLTSNLRGFKSHDFGDSFFHKLRLVLGLTLDVLKGIRSREVTFYFLPRSLSASSNANDIWFMSVITLLRDSTSNTTSAMYTINLNMWEVI